MCGIIGAIAVRDVVPILINGLQRLEYRGYDSAGIAVLNDRVQCVRTVGRVTSLSQSLIQRDMHAPIGIGHTRWATHGGVTESNAHPHVSNGQIAVVHNGIIENHEDHRIRLGKLGYAFESQTDTEVIAHLVHHYFQDSRNLTEAVRFATAQLEGAYAIAVIALGDPDTVVSARMGCPLLIGSSDIGNFLASDVSALLDVTRNFVHLEDGDVATLCRDGVTITDRTGAIVQRKTICSNVSTASLELGPHPCFMHKEIHEQPVALLETVGRGLETGFISELFGQGAEVLFRDVDSVQILAAGTSFHAGLIAKHWIESLARLPVAVEVASEYRYRQPIMNNHELVVTISQSGETLDTLEALKHAMEFGHERTLAICNVPESAIPRASTLTFYTKAGIEIGVASTKAFTTQLVALFMLAVVLAKQRALLSDAAEAECRRELEKIAAATREALTLDTQIEKWAKLFARRENALFLGRGLHFPIALEGALKLKEISYIHAEGYPAGELKHGPLALVDRNMPVVVIAPDDALLQKIHSNMQEVRARGGQLFVLTNARSRIKSGSETHVIHTPAYSGHLSPVVQVIPLQLLAYHTARELDRDVDKPRNLAKSVTVE